MKTKTPITELIAYMNQNRYFIGNDLYAEFERFLTLERLHIERAYAAGKCAVIDRNVMASEDYFKENYVQGRD